MSLRLYSYVSLLLQTCANVQNRRGRTWAARGFSSSACSKNKAFIISILGLTFRRFGSNFAKRIGADFFLHATVSTRFPQRDAVVNLRKPIKKDPFSSLNGRFRAHGIGVTLAEICGRPSDRSRSSQDSRREEKQGSQERQNAVDGDSCDAERKQNQPNKGIQHQGKQRKRPTEEEQDAPEQESDHGHLLTTHYASARREVPSFRKPLSLSLRAIDAGTSASSNMCESWTSERNTRPSA